MIRPFFNDFVGVGEAVKITLGSAMGSDANPHLVTFLAPGEAGRAKVALGF